MRYFINMAVQLFMTLWTFFYVIVIFVGLLMSVGPTDFNGRPNTLADHLGSAILLIFLVMQGYLAVRLIKQPAWRVVGWLVGLAATPWLFWFVVDGMKDASYFVPVAIYTVGLTLLYSGAAWMKALDPPHKPAKP